MAVWLVIGAYLNNVTGTVIQRAMKFNKDNLSLCYTMHAIYQLRHKEAVGTAQESVNSL